MSDSVRMVDTVALAKNLDSLREHDPEYRAHARRLAGHATARHLEELHQDVERSEEAAEARIRDRRNRRRQPSQGEGEDSERREAKEADSVPEMDEGHLLDLRA